MMKHIRNISVSCGCFRAGTRVLTLTLGRMLTSTSIRSPTVLVFCSKLQLSFPSLSSVSHVSVFKRPWVISPRFFISTPARKSCQLPARWRRRYEHFKPSHMCWEADKYPSVSPQQKQQELKRVEKWLKMVKNWDKYRNSEKVCVWPHFHLLVPHNVLNHFYFILIFFPFSFYPPHFPTISRLHD